MMGWLKNLDFEVKVFAGIALAIIALCAWLIPLAIRADNEYAQWCQAQGGHVDSSTSTGVGTGINPANGQVTTVTTSNTTTFCLSDDGRILDVRN